MRFDDDWQRSVLAAGDEVLLSLDVSLGSQTSSSGDELGLLWEAEPEPFAARFPDSGVVESYGGSWSSVHCIDFWVYVDRASGSATTSFEGWTGPDRVVTLSGDADEDAAIVVRLLREHLRLTPG